MLDAIKTEADTLKTLREAMGVDGVVSPGAMNAFEDQIDIIQETQEQI